MPNWVRGQVDIECSEEKSSANLNAVNDRISNILRKQKEEKREHRINEIFSIDLFPEYDGIQDEKKYDRDYLESEMGSRQIWLSDFAGLKGSPISDGNSFYCESAFVCPTKFLHKFTVLLSANDDEVIMSGVFQHETDGSYEVIAVSKNRLYEKRVDFMSDIKSDWESEQQAKAIRSMSEEAFQESSSV